MKIFKRKPKKSSDKTAAEVPTDGTSERITNMTVEHYRQEILAKASRFKTPTEANRATLVRRTILIASLALLVFVGVFLFSVYERGNTSEFAYNVSKVFPLPIARVEGEPVLLRDYLAPYLASKYYAETNNPTQNNADADRVYKQQSIYQAVDVAYARKIAREHQLAVTDEMIDQYFQRTAIGFFNADRMLADKASQVIATNFGISVEDYRNILVKNALLIRLARITVDDEAKALADEIGEQIKVDGSNFSDIAKKYSQDQRVIITTYSDVPHTNNDSGRSVRALELKPNQASGFFNEEQSGDYTVVKLISKDDKKLTFQSITIPLTKFRLQTEGLKRNQVEFYIDTKDILAPEEVSTTDVVPEAEAEQPPVQD